MQIQHTVVCFGTIYLFFGAKILYPSILRAEWCFFIDVVCVCVCVFLFFLN